MGIWRGWGYTRSAVPRKIYNSDPLLCDQSDPVNCQPPTNPLRCFSPRVGGEVSISYLLYGRRIGLCAALRGVGWGEGWCWHKLVATTAMELPRRLYDLDQWRRCTCAGSRLSNGCLGPAGRRVALGPPHTLSRSKNGGHLWSDAKTSVK